jgi:RNA polymerase sigma-70 factor (ECF subfamily)
MLGEKSVSFETVYRATYSLLIKIAYHITNDMEASEDLCQEAYIRYFNRKEPIPSADEAKYWLIRVVKNLCYNHTKRKGREYKAYGKYGREAKTVAQSSEIDLLKKETSEIVRNALFTLPFTLRIVLILREYGGLSYREIGSILRITEGNVKVRVFRAREQLAKKLKEDEVHVS